MAANLPHEANVALVCREMKWTWEDYHSSPAYFVDIITEMLKAEAKDAERRRKEQQ